MRICIYGAGAIGGHLAAKLAASGNEVSVVARGANLAAIRQKGVLLRHCDQQEIHGAVKASDNPADLGEQDLVIVTLKANALAALAGNIHHLLKAGTGVVFAQNGIPWWYAVGLSKDRPAVWSKLLLNLSTATLCMLSPAGRWPMCAASRRWSNRTSASPLAFARAAGVAAPTLEAPVALVAYRAAANGLYSV